MELRRPHAEYRRTGMRLYVFLMVSSIHPGLPALLPDRSEPIASRFIHQIVWQVGAPTRYVQDQ